MFYKKIFVLMLFIASMMIFVVGCSNETAAKSFETQKIREGLNLFNSADYKCAISLLDEISTLKLNTTAEYNLRGEYLVKIGEYYYDTMNYDKGKELFDLAIRDYDSAIKLAPNNVDAYIGRGNAYANTGHLVQRDLNKAIELNPNDFRAYMARSIIYLNVGQNNLALEDANKAVELNPDNPAVYNNRGLVYHNLKQYDSALQDYSESILTRIFLSSSIKDTSRRGYTK